MNTQIARLRFDSGMNQAQFGELFGLTQSTISRAEQGGDYTPAAHSVSAVAICMRCSRSMATALLRSQLAENELKRVQKFIARKAARKEAQVKRAILSFYTQ